ncbi:MAG TPA: MerR family transcriptional regulator [Actinomycetota bacterium]|jgi:DNA-binding transcriptional MerR regulator
MEPKPPDLLTVDELAHRAGTTTRTVRAYQTKGLLPAPHKIGRIAYYGPEHLARLDLIERLLSRGFLLSAIGDLLRASEQGSGLAGVLGHPALQGRSTEAPGPSSQPPAAAAGPSAPALEQAEALRDQLASISARFVDLLRREAWKAAVDEIRAADRRESDLGEEEPGDAESPAAPGGRASGQVLDEADELQRELAAVSDRFVDLLRREAWRAAVTEIREADGI